MTRRDEILEVLHRLEAALDDGDIAAVAACFTQDGSLQMTAKDGTVLLPEVAGRETLEAVYGRARGTHHEVGRFQRHMVLNCVVEDLDDEAATVRSTQLTVGIGEGGPEIDGVARLLDELVLDDGRWLIRRRRLVLEGMSRTVQDMAATIQARVGAGSAEP